jgi:dephospho-CoA kinase
VKMHGDLSRLNGDTKIIILVGESGAGKSTLAGFLNMPDSWFVSSGLMIEIIIKKGLPVNHDTIHQTANEKYGEDPYWQIPHMLRILNETSFLLLDGPRRTDEVYRLLELCPQYVIISVLASSQKRQKRLNERDGSDDNAFKRVIADEKSETGLVDCIISMAHITVENDGPLEDLQDAAKQILTRIKRRTVP